MINELSLLKLNPETASTKQKIISILSEHFPLSTKEIHSKLVRKYATEISYQGTHKTVQEMVEEKIIEKDSSGYQLGIDWIQKTKKVFEDVEKKYLKKDQINIPRDFSGRIELEYDSLTDLYVSFAELYASRQLVNSSDDTLYGNLEYGWFPFKFKFEHFELLARMILTNRKANCIIRKKTNFGEYIRQEYNRVGMNCIINEANSGLDEDLQIQGDYIIEVKYDTTTKEIIEKYYNKWKNTEDAFKEFGLKEEPKVHATMRITKNREMAEFMRKQLNKAFFKGAEA